MEKKEKNFNKCEGGKSDIFYESRPIVTREQLF